MKNALAVVQSPNLHKPEAVQIHQVAKALRPLLRYLVMEARYTAEPDLAQILADNPRLIHIMNHGPMMAPWTAASLMAERVVQAGGGQRRPFAVVHRRLFEVPVLRDWLRTRFNTDHAFSFQEVLERLARQEFTDFCVLPEGANEQIGDVYELSPFKSHRYVELAVRLQAPILITVHRGFERWAVTFQLDEFNMQLLRRVAPKAYDRMRATRRVNLQGLPVPIPVVWMHSFLYHPLLKQEELADDPNERKAQVSMESERVRSHMLAALQKLERLEHQEE